MTLVKSPLIREGIIVALDRHFVVCPVGAGVDEGDLIYTVSSTQAPPV